MNLPARRRRAPFEGTPPAHGAITPRDPRPQAEIVPVPVPRPERPPAVPVHVREAVVRHVGNDTATNASALLEQWLSARDPHTRRSYHTAFAQLAAFLGGGVTPTEAAQALLGSDGATGNALLGKFRDHLQAGGLAPGTVAVRISAFRSFLKFLRGLSLVHWDVVVETPQPVAYRDTSGPAPGVIAALRALILSQEGPRRLRDYVLFRLLFGHGLRRGEVVGLDLAHIDLLQERAWVLGKRRVEREPIPLSPSTIKAIRMYLDGERGREPGPLFPSRAVTKSANGRLTGHGVWRIFRRYAAELDSRLDGVDVKVRPHGLRHAAITQLAVARPDDLRALQAFSRHKSWDTLQVYIDRASGREREMATLLDDGDGDERDLETILREISEQLGQSKKGEEIP